MIWVIRNTDQSALAQRHVAMVERALLAQRAAADGRRSVSFRQAEFRLHRSCFRSSGFARANDLPWKNFAYRLIRGARAAGPPRRTEWPDVHAASRISMGWRIAPLVGDLDKRRQASAGAGRPPDRLPGMAAVPWATLAMRELRRRIYAPRLNQWGPKAGRATEP
jgi:hypothetical protein